MFKHIIICYYVLLLSISDILCADLDGNILYADIKPADTADSLRRVREAPFVYYKFAHDSVSDRRQMGVIGPDAQRYFPESIEVVSTYSIPNKNKSKPPIVVNNFPMIDKNIIFMHGVAAVQELMKIYESLNITVNNLSFKDSELLESFKAVEKKLQQDASQQVLEAVEIAKLEEEVTRKELELIAFRREEDLRIKKVTAEEEKAVLQYETELAHERLQQEEKLARESMLTIIKLERDLLERKEKLSHEAAISIEILRAKQANQLDEKKLELEKQRITAEVEAQAKRDQQKEEMETRKRELQAKLETERIADSVKLVSGQVKVLVTEFLSRPKQLAIIALILLGFVATYYSIKEVIVFIRYIIQSQIGRPTLVRETSYHWSLIPSWVENLFSRREKISISIKKTEDIFKDIILSFEDKARVVNLAVSTQNTRRSNANFRHVLLHGPPGNGKTLIARRLAKCSGMDYAIMSGGDIAPLGEDAVNQLHNLFKWAEKSRKGLLVFIDEAEAFLATRSASNLDSTAEVHIRNALNALLYQTGTPSKKFMLVLATNRPEDLDAAIQDRIDVSLQINRPGPLQVLDLIKYYFNLHVISVAKSSQKHFFLWYYLFNYPKYSIEHDCLTEDILIEIASKLDGFSGREISKLFISIQYGMFLADNQTLTKNGLLSIVQTKVQEHNFKVGDKNAVTQLQNYLTDTSLKSNGKEKSSKRK
eukprot:gene6248-8606_t